MKRVHRLTIEHQRIRGVAQLNGRLYVACLRSSAILVYSAETFHLETDIVVKDLCNPNDIVACQVNRCCYVGDHGRAVWRINGDNTVEAWLEGAAMRAFTVDKYIGSAETWTLSTAGGRVLLTTGRRLLVYGSDGRRIADIRLEVGGVDGDSLPEPTLTRHAVISSPATVTICESAGACGPGGVLGRLAEVAMTGDGRAIRASAVAPTLFGPGYFVQDPVTRMFFVADTAGRRVLLFDARLDVVRVLLTTVDDVEKPLRLSYDRNSDRLVVAMDGEYIDIYSVREADPVTPSAKVEKWRSNRRDL